MSMSVCLLTYLRNYMAKLHKIFCESWLWPWGVYVLWMTSCLHTMGRVVRRVFWSGKRISYGADSSASFPTKFQPLNENVLSIWRIFHLQTPAEQHIIYWWQVCNQQNAVIHGEYYAMKNKRCLKHVHIILSQNIETVAQLQPVLDNNTAIALTKLKSQAPPSDVNNGNDVN